MTFEVRQLGPHDLSYMHGVLDAFAAAFEDPASYSGSRPSPGYLSRLLASETFVCLAAIDDGEVIGGLTAYELIKFEQERSEIYIFDLGVLSSHRRRGVAKRLIEALRSIARSRKASVVFVQADHDDDPAITLYASLGKGREILHFDISTD